jgi:hypothetical protein
MNFPYYCYVISLLKKPTIESMLQYVTSYYTAYRKKTFDFCVLTLCGTLHKYNPHVKWDVPVCTLGKAHQNFVFDLLCKYHYMCKPFSPRRINNFSDLANQLSTECHHPEVETWVSLIVTCVYNLEVLFPLRF